MYCKEMWKTDIINIFPSLNIRQLNFLFLLDYFDIDSFHLNNKMNKSVHLKDVQTVGHKDFANGIKAIAPYIS